MRLVVYTNENLKNNGGSFAILMPTGELSLEATIAKDIPEGSKHKIVDLDLPLEKAEIDKVLPSGTETVSYWTAWEANLNDTEAPISFAINLEKAKEIFAQYIRRARVKDLSALDIDYQRADELGDSALKATIAAKKQKLRDMPSDTRIVNCSDFDTLKTLTYEYLRDN